MRQSPKTLISVAPDKTWVKITYAIDPTRQYSKKDLAEYIESLTKICSEMEDYPGILN